MSPTANVLLAMSARRYPASGTRAIATAHVGYIREVIVLDGPMGTELAARGVPVPPPGWSAYALRSRPELVTEIHAAYARAGATVHRANTFRVQARLFPGDEHDALCASAVELARVAAGSGRVAGSMAPV